jgi:hypothetical protein
MSLPRVVVLSDMQIPYHSMRDVKGVLEFVKDYKPDLLLNVGDEIDQPQPSRWNKGSVGEYEPTLQRDIDLNREIQADFKSALKRGAEYHISRSNHGDRIQTYVNRYAPALRALRALNLEDLLGYNDLGIHFHRKPFEFAPGWLLCHGDEASLSRIPGATAKNLAVRWDMNVVCGHTHKRGSIPHSFGFGSRQRTVVGVEVGCLMDFKKASYIKDGAPAWQKGIGVGVLDGRKTRITDVEVRNGEVLL